MKIGGIKPGHLLAGRYRIEEPIGSGGHAYVFSARQEGLDRKVAVKLLKSAPALASEDLPPDKIQTLIKRFEREAKLISQLRDPGTITMYDYGATDDGFLYMVVEYIEGPTIKDLLDEGAPIEPERVVQILRQLLHSLHEAHSAGVLHRDIKPDNIMLFPHLGKREQVRLLDFGIAKLTDDALDDMGGDLTTEGALVGTPRYVAPERVRGEELLPASDLYSLGLVANEMLTGERVMPGKFGVHALQAQVRAPSIVLPYHIDIPENLRCIVDRMTTKDLDARYEHAGQVLHDLDYWDSLDFLPSESETELETVPVSIKTLESKLEDDARFKQDQIDLIKQKVEENKRAAKEALLARGGDAHASTHRAATKRVEKVSSEFIHHAPTTRTPAISPPPPQPSSRGVSRRTVQDNSQTQDALPVYDKGASPRKSWRDALPGWLISLLIAAVVFDLAVILYLLSRG